MVKKLTFDALEEEGEVDDLELTLNGTKVTIYKPTTGQTAIMMAAFADNTPAPESAAALLNFYKGITEDDGYDAIKSILENPRIPDSLEQLMSLTEKVIEAFSGNPTRQPADYLPSQKRTGQNSTGSRQATASRRSSSRSRAS